MTSKRPSSAVVVVDDAYFSVKHLAAYAGLSERTLRSYLTHPLHPLPSFKVGGRVVVRRSEYDAWVARFRCAATSSVDAIVADAMRGL
jgi:Helix-turn-helix domain